MSEAYNPQQSKDLLYVCTLHDTESGKHSGMFTLTQYSDTDVLVCL
jgi:hypothetical protein